MRYIMQDYTRPDRRWEPPLQDKGRQGRRHADQQCRLHAPALQELRYEQHEDDFGHLPEGLFARGVRQAQLGEKLVGIQLIEFTRARVGM